MIDELRFHFISHSIDQLNERYHSEEKHQTHYIEDERQLAALISELEDCSDAQRDLIQSKLNDFLSKFKVDSTSYQTVKGLISTLFPNLDDSRPSPFKNY